ncbi:hypothetical protein CWM57_06420 [Klebsiella sp. G-Nf4]|nr:hypothetical protein CWM64_08245 [Klebsiella sp. I-Nf8]PJR63771.1 hypothetical protein CWM61_12045 [Klebsiella sp. K-Nf6]PJX32916.1 hypothetical protein CWM53_07110 [Klebsiella sp. A-Nf5]PJX36482.1 hypothetical protein CWM59_17025 [Klebsiella sp. B-Nf7]PJX43066.1 hypothetical protein CWM62_09635 [Klebsiella sp. C-Nf10]PJX48802.1 hypothetical protein CWM60_08235 [Klebsiella sp. C1-16S-Nf17]PJX53562.1 hypothetical protein CWM54_11570 [Klebsiella sp. D-Nf1]PJX70722.1 hypothetical protein CWM
MIFSAEIWRSELQNITKHFYDINSLAPIDLFAINYIALNQSVKSFFCCKPFSSKRLFLSQIPAKRAALLAV